MQFVADAYITDPILTHKPRYHISDYSRIVMPKIDTSPILEECGKCQNLWGTITCWNITSYLLASVIVKRKLIKLSEFHWNEHILIGTADVVKD